MGAGREKNQSDFDFERFCELFDQALTSNDERVKNALRGLMTMVVLTAPESNEQRIGPFKQMMEDHRMLIRRLNDMSDDIRELKSYHRTATDQDAFQQSLRSHAEVESRRAMSISDFEMKYINRVMSKDPLKGNY